MFSVRMIMAFLTLLFAASFADAYPEVGDRVEWVGSIDNQDGKAIQIKVTKEVLSRDEKSKSWSVKKVIQFGDETTEEINDVKNLYAPEQFKQTLESCEKSGGKLEEVTVPAGTYATCKITTVTDEGRVDDRWWGDVPFGLVRKNTTNRNAAANKKLDLRSVMAGL